MFYSVREIQGDPFRAITRANLAKTPEWASLPPDLRETVEVVSAVLPFRTNRYVMSELIDWERIPDDPMFQLTFPQRGMLTEGDYKEILRLQSLGRPHEEIEQAAQRIRLGLNPHPAGQLTHNVPELDGRPVPGVQHKYRETVLFFPSQGQTCHVYCTFCFRWPQFVGMGGLKFAGNDRDLLARYLECHPEVTDVLLTGGDPLIMSTKHLRRYVEALLVPSLEHVQTIRIGTKAVASWPHRFVTDRDADDLMRLFEEITASGRHLAIMGQYAHPIELFTETAQAAIRRIRSTGAQIRMQAPLLRHINDDAETWASLWREGARLGVTPYYMFVERDTGARRYFELPLVRAWEIFRHAYQQVSGLARTARGPSMSAFPGKVRVNGVTVRGDEKVFVLEYLQARDPNLVCRPFFARFDPQATWFNQLEPATGEDIEFFPHLHGDAGGSEPVRIGGA